MKATQMLGKGFSLAGIAIAGGMLLSSTPAMAGQHEWATAGKILTGIVAADVLFNHLLPPPYVETRVVYPPPPPSAQVVQYYAPPPPPVVVYYSNGYYYPPPAWCPPEPVIIYRKSPRRGWFEDSGFHGRAGMGDARRFPGHR